jgi:tellurite resistance protein TerC
MVCVVILSHNYRIKTALLWLIVFTRDTAQGTVFMQSVSNGWLWLSFIILVIMILIIDLFFLGRGKSRQVSMREALAWSSIWILCGLIFNCILWWFLLKTQGVGQANHGAEEFFTAFLVGKAMSIDNVFVFIMIFGEFAISNQYQQRVLLFAVIGAVVIRLVLTMLGIGLITEVHWVFYLFGLFVLLSGIKIIFAKKRKKVESSFLLEWLQKHLHTTAKFNGQRFFIAQHGLRYVTPLFLALVLIEENNFLFAIDSIPAVFAVTLNPFIVFTSNIFAVLGLRALYFLLTQAAKRFHLLKYGIGIMLIFIGIKMLAAFWIKIPVQITLTMIIGILSASFLLSNVSRSNIK